MKRLCLKIYGCVHGVFFRATTAEQARQLGLVGFVRNCTGFPSSGLAGQDSECVEVVAEGAEQALRELLAYCQHGPPLARVEKTEEEWSEVEAISFVTFTIR